MVNAINKIKEMQIKLNVINNNIEQIKNKRKSIEENNKLNNNSFNYNIEKNYYYNNLKRNKINNIKSNSSYINKFSFNHICNNKKKDENKNKNNNDIFLNNKNFLDNYGNKKIKIELRQV